jgi:hypothetical protein
LKRYIDGNKQDMKTKERVLLVLNVVYSVMVAVQVARDMH